MSFLDDCRKAVAKWAGILGLGSTTIGVQVRNDLPVGVLAMCSPSWEYDEAIICFREGSYDVDAVAAHEVLHIPFALFNTKAGTWERRIEERLVETLSKAMVALSRDAKIDPARLATTCREMLRSNIRARRALAAGRYRTMDPELAKLIMSLGAMLESEQVSEELRATIEALVAKATGATDAAPPSEPPMAGTPPDAPAAEDPSAPPAMASPDDPIAPAARVATPRISISATARAHILAAERDAKEAAERSKAAAELARKRLALEENGYRDALFRSAPDVFPAEAPAIRDAYKAAKPDEIERYIAAERARRAADPRGQDGRFRVVQQEGQPREPAPGGAAVKNDGGVVIRQAGRVVS